MLNEELATLKEPEREPGREPERDPVKTAVRVAKTCIEKLKEDMSLDDLNEVLSKIGQHFNENELSIEEFCLSLEFSQIKIDGLKQEKSSSEKANHTTAAAGPKD